MFRKRYAETIGFGDAWIWILTSRIKVPAETSDGFDWVYTMGGKDYNVLAPSN